MGDISCKYYEFMPDFYLKHSFKMPKHAKEHVDFVKRFCICCFRKVKDLRTNK